MITIKLQGGLGNQMFQYAYGIALQRATGAKVFYDDSFFENSVKFAGITSRAYELDIFSIKVPRPPAIVNWKKWLIKAGLKKTISLPHFIEPSLLFDESFLKLTDSCTVQGYFASEKYFYGITKEMRKLYHFPMHMLGSKNQELTDVMIKHPSTAIHVRRGDFIEHENNLHFHGICSAAYYKHAIEHIERKYGPQRWFIFSDDPNWCREYLAWIKPFAVVSWNQGKDAWKDMCLMSTCSHQIIANSTFSWWAAWLNKNPNKTVIAPTPWIANNDPQFDDRDLVPESWVKLDITLGKPCSN